MVWLIIYWSSTDKSSSRWISIKLFLVSQQLYIAYNVWRSTFYHPMGCRNATIPLTEQWTHLRRTFILNIIHPRTHMSPGRRVKVWCLIIARNLNKMNSDYFVICFGCSTPLSLFMLWKLQQWEAFTRCALWN